MPTRFAALLLALALAGPAHAATPAKVAVLYSQATPTMRAALPAAACDFYPIEGFRAPRRPADAVVLAGHSLPPAYLDRPADEVARAIAAFRPRLVVLDTCYGASTPLLAALATGLPGAWVVAAPYRLPQDGLVYGPAFLAAADPARRAAAVRTEPVFPLLRWKLDARAVTTARTQVEALDAAGLRRRLKRARPPLVRGALPAVPGPAGEVLVPMPVERFRALATPARTGARPPG